MRWAAVAIALFSAQPAFAHLSRPTNREPEPLQYDAEDAILSFTPAGSRFQVHYVIDGRNGVGSENLDGDAVVDRVERISAAYEAAQQRFTELGFDPPPSDGDEWLDVYVLDTGEIPGGRLIESCPADRPTKCWSFIVHPIAATDDDTFAERALFRSVLSGYRTYFDNPFEAGCAAWIAGDTTLAPLYLAATASSLGDATIAEDGGTALFLDHLDDVDLLRNLWIDIGAANTRPDWRALLDTRLTERGSSLAIEFNAFALSLVESIEPSQPEDLIEFAPLSARYYASEVELEGAGLEQSIAGTVLVAVNPTLAAIQAERRGCTCMTTTAGAQLLIPWLLGSLLRSARRRPSFPRSGS